MKEVWKDINGYDGLYQVSNMGRIRSYKPINQHFNKRDKPILLKQAKRSRNTNYLCVTLHKDGKQKTGCVHKIVAEHFMDDKPSPNHQINHKDGDPTNNKVDNLEWVTAKENIEHAINNGLSDRIGESNGRAKLDENDVKHIRSKHETGDYSISELSNIYHVSRRQIGRIIDREAWTHV